MGIYINKGNGGFRQIRNSEYVDKSELISVVNKTLFTEQKFTCVTRCRSYWASTGAYDTVARYIQMNYEGLKDDIIKMLAGGRCKVNPTKFQNDMSIVRSKDDVLTVLIHLGYLSYEWKKSEPARRHQL